MLETQFYLRILLIVILGVVFITAMAKMGKRGSMEQLPQKHIFPKVLACLFLVSSLLSIVLGFMTIEYLQFPKEMIPPPVNSNTIIRSITNVLWWGTPTPIQSRILNYIIICFSCLALSAYFYNFRCSGTSIGIKILKVIGIGLLWIFYVSASDFHYFDIWEFIAPSLFVLLLILNMSLGWRSHSESDTTPNCGNSTEEECAKISNGQDKVEPLIERINVDL